MFHWIEWKEVDGIAMRLVAGDSGLRAIEFTPTGAAPGMQNCSHPVLIEAIGQLREYFEGSRREFTVPLDFAGTDFQKRVWRALLAIPYGETRTYREIAMAIEAPAAVRAVGAANGANPLPIIVPCHRVIGSSGKLVGYGGGLPLKKRLLELERESGGHQLCTDFLHSLSIT
jgi:methylated-DNA-[protein]-cysteine S-methyltransferase